VIYHHAILCVVEEMIQEMLLPCLGGVRETPDACCDEVHMEHGHLGPSTERGLESQFYRSVNQ